MDLKSKAKRENDWLKKEMSTKFKEIDSQLVEWVISEKTEGEWMNEQKMNSTESTRQSFMKRNKTRMKAFMQTMAGFSNFTSNNFRWERGLLSLRRYHKISNRQWFISANMVYCIRIFMIITLPAHRYTTRESNSLITLLNKSIANSIRLCMYVQYFPKSLHYHVRKDNIEDVLKEDRMVKWINLCRIPACENYALIIFVHHDTRVVLLQHKFT